jgi:tRNA 5-methylaminomethyl-2-thiouridine biosynthesis bifunctional protein
MVADAVVVAAAAECRTLLADHGLRLNAVGGQVSEIAAGDAAAKPRSILCHKGYVIPLADRYLVGATYTHEGDMLAVTDGNHAHNLAELAAILPAEANATLLGGRASLRATTPDRMPYIGTLAAGLYVSTGHGSRGMLSAPLAAEMIASAIMGEVSPVKNDLRAAVHPHRFKR